MSVIEIRPARQGDLPSIVELKLRMFTEAGVESYLAPDARGRILLDYQQFYQEGKVQHFVAECNGAIVAMVGAFLKDELPFRYWKNPIYGTVGDMYTRPHHRRQGLARKLTKQALAWLKSRNVSMIRLVAFGPGRTIFEELGFKPSQEMVVFWGE